MDRNIPTSIIFIVLVLVPVIWSQLQEGGAFDDQWTAFTKDSNSQLITVGYFQNTTVFGEVTLTATKYDGFITKYNTNPILSVNWTTSIYGPEDEKIYSVATDSSYNVFIGGLSTSDIVNINGGSCSKSQEGGFAFIAKLDSSDGHCLWMVTFSNTTS